MAEQDPSSESGSEARPEQRKNEIETLLQFVDRLTAAGDAAEVLQSVMEVLAPLLSVKRVGIVTNQGDHALSIGLWDNGVWRPGGTKIPLEDSVSGWVIRNRRMWRTEDLPNDPMHFRGIAALNGVAIGASMAVPIFAGDGAVLGVLNLHSEQTGNQFSDDDVRLAEGLARHLAIPLERVQLIRELRRSEERFRHQAFTDSLTGLHNRAWLMGRLPEAIDRAHGRAGGLALIYLDLDGFKVINDTLGHSSGDAVLAAIALRLHDAAPDPELVARLGGDEFVVLAEELDSAAEALQLAGRLGDAVRHRVRLRGRQRAMSACAGVALYPAGMPSYRAERMLREADIALYTAKAQGRGQIILFEPRLSHLALQRMDLETDLQRALDRRQLLLHYQPVFGLYDRDLRGIEALIRWGHPRRGILPAGDFLRLAEESGLLTPIADWALEEACRQAGRWQRQAGSGRQAWPALSVNVAAAQLQQPGFVERLAGLLATAAVGPSAIEVEIGAGALLHDSNTVIDAIGALHDLGVRLAIDDFGAPGSSLASLGSLPLDRVKIDRTLVASVEEHAGTRTIVRALIDLAHDLQIDVTAEGIESQGQLEFLRLAGCDCGQGFLLARPVAAEEIDRTLLGVSV